MAATEFAIIMPILTTLLFGLLEVTDAMTANRRVSIATNTSVDLAAQAVTLDPDSLSGLFDASITILEPAVLTDIAIIFVSVRLDPMTDDPIVAWSARVTLNEDEDIIVQDGDDAPYQPGDDFNNLGSNFASGSTGLTLNSGGSVLYSEVTYPYNTMFSHRFVDEVINFSRSAIRTPRLVPRISFCDTNGDNCLQ